MPSETLVLQVISVAITTINYVQGISFVSNFDFHWPSAMESLLHAMESVTGGATKVVGLQCFVRPCYYRLKR